MRVPSGFRVFDYKGYLLEIFKTDLVGESRGPLNVSDRRHRGNQGAGPLKRCLLRTAHSLRRFAPGSALRKTGPTKRAGEAGSRPRAGGLGRGWT